MNNLTPTQIEQIAAGLAELGWTTSRHDRTVIGLGGRYLAIRPGAISTMGVNLLDPHWQSALAVIARVLEGGEEVDVSR